MKHVDKKSLIKVGFRLSLLHCTWFEGGMQSTGLAYCLIPGLKALYSDQDAFQSALQRYCRQPFNTHPFLVGYIAGALLKMEAEQQAPDAITAFSSQTMGLVAAFGDPFFRSALPCFVSSVACLAAILGGPWVGITTLLILFNGIHFAVRLGGVTLGYREGSGVIVRVGKFFSTARTEWIRKMAAVFCGMVLVLVAFTFDVHATADMGLAILATTGCLALGGLLTKWVSLQQYAIPLVVSILVLIEVAI